MKKIIVLAIAIASFTTGFSQSNRNWDHPQDHGRSTKPEQRSPAYGHNNYPADYGYNNQRHNNGYDRQAAIERVNREYDQRIYSYRNNHSFNRFERERMIRNAENERAQRLHSFGGGVAIGAVAGLVLGSILSH